MFRIIASGKESFSNEDAQGVFGMRGALHRSPRRYKHLDSAIAKAVQNKTGVYEIMDDERNIVAVVRAGKLIGTVKEAFEESNALQGLLQSFRLIRESVG